MTIFVEKRQLVLPGDLLAENGYEMGLNVYKEDGKIYAVKVGLAEHDDRKISVVPLKGCYVPYVGDQVIGKIVDVGLSGWLLDINTAYQAMLPLSEAIGRRQTHVKTELTSILNIGDLVLAKVIAFDRTRDPLLTIRGPGLGRITSGRTMKISSTKIPRLIGRKGSMVSMIKRETGCEIIIGQNGVVVVSGRSPIKVKAAVEAISMVEREAHTEGLTDRVKEHIRRMVENVELQ
ncbi:MAG: exosome complex RNA-binding protein Rrp4 [Candidatus Bathyarchaeia archaeon]